MNIVASQVRNGVLYLLFNDGGPHPIVVQTVITDIRLNYGTHGELTGGIKLSVTETKHVHPEDFIRSANVVPEPLLLKSDT